MNTKKNVVEAIDLNTLVAYSAQIKEVATALLSGKPEQLTEEQQEANDKAADSLASKVKSFAEQTEADGIDAHTANSIMRQGLAISGVKPGTAANYGRSVEGYRKLAAVVDGGWAKVHAESTTKDAQQIMRSDETVARDEVKAALAVYTKAATLEQLRALLAVAEGLEIKLTAKDAGKVVTTKPEAEQVGENVGEAVAA